MLGVNSPNLGLINERVLGSELPLRGELLFSGSASPAQVEYSIPNPLPEIKYGTEAGIEFSMEVDERNRFVIGLSSWEGVSTALVKTTLAFQGRLLSTNFERHASISYLQYYIGWRRDFFVKHNKYRLYGSLLLNEIFDIDFRENFVYEFIDTTDGSGSFKRVLRQESQATGHIMLQPAVGGEYFLRDWLSVGVDLGYLFGLNDFELGNVESTTDFQGQDQVTIAYPASVINDGRGRLGYYDPNSESYQKMELDMNGWRALFRINIYY